MLLSKAKGQNMRLMTQHAGVFSHVLQCLQKFEDHTEANTLYSTLFALEEY